VDGIYHIINHVFLWEHNEFKGGKPNPVSHTTYEAIRTDLYGSLVGRGFLSLQRIFEIDFFFYVEDIVTRSEYVSKTMSDVEAI
jgi:hypothetical protein